MIQGLDTFKVFFKGYEDRYTLKQVFTQLPNAQTIEYVDQLLPWNTTL